MTCGWWARGHMQVSIQITTCGLLLLWPPAICTIEWKMQERATGEGELQVPSSNVKLSEYWNAQHCLPVLSFGSVSVWIL